MDDVSILGQSLQMPLIGFREAKSAYDNGTEEIRRLLMDECTLIYECNMCRNLFRNFTNFITHKRVYCKQYSQEYFSKKSDPPHSTIVIQKNRAHNIIENVTIPNLSNILPNKNVNAEGPVSFTDKKEEAIRNGNESDVESVHQQRLKLQQPANNIKTELDEVCNMLNEKVMLSNGGKTLLNEFSLNDINIKENGNNDAATFPCEICHLTFQTENILKLHYQNKHNSSSTYAFPCPTCSLTFSQPAAVIRHLSNEHKKPMKHVRKMRDAILRKRLQISDANVHAQVKGASRDLKRLQLNDTTNTKDVENSKIDNNSPSINKKSKSSISVCTYCKKRFEKRTVLSAHLQNCTLKKALHNNHNNNISKNSKSSKINNSNSSCSSVNQINQSTPAVNAKRLTVLPLKVLQETGTSVTSKMLKEGGINVKNEFIEHNSNKKCQNENHLNATNNNDEQLNVSLLNEMFENLEKTDFGRGLETLTFDKFDELMTMEDNNSNGSMANNTAQVKMNGENDNKLSPSQLQSLTSSSSSSSLETTTLEILPNSIASTTSLSILSSTSTCTSKSTSTTISSVASLLQDKCDDKDPLMITSLDNIIEKKSETKKPLRQPDPSKQLTCRCKICNKQFNALSNLRRHISLFHYRAHRFGCTLCEYRAFRRYDIVNHLVSLHKMTIDREIMATEYVSVHEVNYSKDDVEGDILVISNDDTAIINQCVGETEKQKLQQPKNIANKRKYRSRSLMITNSTSAALNGNLKMAKQRLRKTGKGGIGGQTTTVDGRHLQRRPIRNRIKPEKKDFLYDMTHLQKDNRVNMKRRNTMLGDHKETMIPDLTPPPIKIVPYRLRTGPLLPANKEKIRGAMERIYRKQVTQGLAAPSTVPELPTERPCMRPRLISTCRNDLNSVPVIEASELEAVRLKATVLEDSFLEKLAKRTNTSFRMKPLLSLQQHSPLNTILQKFDTSLQLSHSHNKVNINETNSNTIENVVTSSLSMASPEYSKLSVSQDVTTQQQQMQLLASMSTSKSSHCVTDIMLGSNKTSSASLQGIANDDQHDQHCTEITPNGKWCTSETINPPAAPKKRISLMQRLVDNRSKRRNSALNAAMQICNKNSE